MVRTSTPNDGKKRGRVGGTWRRVSGREDLDQAMRSRFDPYSYESNWKTLRWLVVFSRRVDRVVNSIGVQR